MIDPYDVELLKKWLKLAQTQGTDAIKIVSTDEDFQNCEVSASYKVMILKKQ